MIFHSLARSVGRLALLVLVFAGFSSAAHAEWWRAETAHFIIYSQDKKSGTEEFATQLERFDNALRTLQNLPVVPAKPLSKANKVTIFRTGDVGDIAYIAGAPESGVAGFYIPRAGAAVAFTPVKEGVRDVRSFSERERDARTELDPRSILQHEYVHHFMLQTFPATYPDWYIEAFAELYGTVALNPDGSFHLGNPPQYRAAQIYQLPDVPLKDLFDQNHKRDGLDQYQFYGYGWLLAHYLNFEPSRQGQLLAYLKALDRGEDGLTAARSAFGDLNQLTREVRSYKSKARSGNFPGFDVKPVNYTPPTVEIRKLTEAETAVMGEFMRSKRGVNRKQARGVAGDIDSKARRYSDSLFVQLAASEAFLDARRFAEADAAADRALAIDPNSTDALIFKGMIAIEQGKDGDKARFAAARAPLLKATNLDPQDPRPLILYYESFRKAGEAAPEDAIVGLEQTFETAAFDAEYRMILARQLLIEGKGPLARNVLAPVAYSFHGDQEKNKLRAVVDLIKENKVPEARAKIDAIFKEAEDKEKKEKEG